jgi:hypothetical protein
MKFVEGGVTDKLVFDPGLGLPPFFGGRERNARTWGLRNQTRSKAFGDGQRKITNEKGDSEVTQDGTFTSVALANESNGLSWFDETLLPRIVSSY